MGARTDIPQLLGYQVADLSGTNIQGDDNDPSGLHSFEIMETELADHFAATHPGFLLMPIYEGDVEEPTFADMGRVNNEWEDAAAENHAKRKPRVFGLERPHMLVLSTAHITKATDERLSSEGSGSGLPTVYPKLCGGIGGEQYGWWFPLASGVDEIVACCPQTPPDLILVMRFAEANGCTWIMLDQDGDTVEGLPTYDW